MFLQFPADPIWSAGGKVSYLVQLYQRNPDQATHTHNPYPPLPYPGAKCVLGDVIHLRGGADGEVLLIILSVSLVGGHNGYYSS